MNKIKLAYTLLGTSLLGFSGCTANHSMTDSNLFSRETTGEELQSLEVASDDGISGTGIFSDHHSESGDGIGGTGMQNPNTVAPSSSKELKTNDGKTRPRELRPNTIERPERIERPEKIERPRSPERPQRERPNSFRRPMV
ncbi:MAG: hypothetical protein CMM25_03095 [Rhodospirillaceae bacterium]|nr:hypothetical protein [Rhodospirillaceae bacterium]|tara:strand:+ start:94 stop:516 length:423 start_codon:yes stop_codon:yes gene_type:complete